jgi:hypothetical protein
MNRRSPRRRWLLSAAAALALAGACGIKGAPKPPDPAAPPAPPEPPRIQTERAPFPPAGVPDGGCINCPEIKTPPP